ncbi:uncharacterized protein [Eurosta solidaginis]|uniref:uncharacterized protein n=1 Tax=Eurosta solidaginis TaxID=178769 RepID=UPI003530F29D
MTFEYSKSIVHIPDFLDLHFAEDVVEGALRETDVKILKVFFEMGSAPGENFCSLVYRMKITYELISSKKRGELSAFVKCLPAIEGVDFLDGLRVFSKEKATFEEILPRLSVFLKPGERFSGRIYHSIKRPLNVLAFEDLNVSGYRNASRELGLDEAHSRLVMKRIAQFHAISMHLSKRLTRDSSIMKLYTYGLISTKSVKPDGFLFNYFAGSAAALLKIVSNWPEYSTISKKLSRYIGNLGNNLERSNASRPDDLFSVLNHGDLWVNNILFKYDDKGQVQDCTFIDYQMTVWGSSGLDLNYFLYSSVQLDVLKSKREELLREYYSNFRAKLAELHYTPLPTFQQVLDEFHRRAGYGFFANFGIYPMVLQDKTKYADSSLDNLVDKEFAKKKLEQVFSSKKLVDTLRYTLKEFDKMGIWD